MRALTREVADMHYQEGIRLLRQPSGSRQDSLEQGIGHFQCALEIYHRLGLRENCAKTLNDLAYAYELRLCGDPSSNQEEAIRMYLQAQEVYTRKDHPCEWAIIQFNLGNVYLRRIEGERQDSHRRAEECYRDALCVFSERCALYQQARVYNSLGVYYLEAVVGNRTDNLEAALNYLNEALKGFRPDKHLVDWVGAKNNLGTAWRHRMQGSRADNLEKSIRCYEEALQVLDPARHQYLWGDVQHNLGLSYLQRVTGARADNLRKAQEHLDIALQARKSAGMTAEAAKTQYQRLILMLIGQMGDQAQHVEQAIRDLQQIEQALSKRVCSLERAKIELGLGNAYLMRVRGDRVRNIEAAIAHYDKALEFITARNAPAEWSYIQIGLAAAYRARPIQDRHQNLDKAIGGLCSGLDTLQQGGWLSEWARMQNNLAGAYWDRARYYREVLFEHDKADADFRQAIVHAQEALTLYSRRDYPFEWALSNYTVGNALGDLRTERSRWSEATGYFRAALEVFTDHYPLQRAWALNDYGVTLLNLVRMVPGQSGQRDLQNAIQLFRKAIQTHKDSGLRTEALRSTINLGALYHALGAWSNAYTELGHAVQMIETLHADALGELGHVHIAEQYTRAYQYLVDTCAYRGQRFWKEALERVEASKARAFLAEIGTDDYPAPSDLPVALGYKECAFLKGLRKVETGLRNLEIAPLGEGEKKQERNRLLQRQERVMAKYDALLKEIELQAPDYVALRRGYPATYAALQPLLDQAEKEIGVVELFPVQGRLLAFVMRCGLRDPIVISVNLDEEMLKSIYLAFEPVLEGERTRAWMDGLGARLFSEVLTHLTGVDLVYVIPSGLLYALPLHALPVNNQSLIERFPVVYAPSLTILSRVITRANYRSREGGESVLVVGNPSGWSEGRFCSLEMAEKIARRVADKFSVEPLLRDAATKQKVLDELPAARVVFFVCHGYFDHQTPLHSGLVMTRTGVGMDSEYILSVREIMERRLSADLVVLSACQSGRNHIKRGDELVGLARAFLYAGASTVIVALWSVSTNSATELVSDFFDCLYPGGRKAAETATAMRKSCLRLLQDDYPDFFDWAPFVVIGDWR